MIGAKLSFSYDPAGRDAPSFVRELPAETIPAEPRVDQTAPKVNQNEPITRQVARAVLKARVHAHLRETHPTASRAHRRQAARLAFAQLQEQLRHGPVPLDEAGCS